jgi:hypothetical protein
MSKVKLSVYVPEALHRQAKYASIERGTTIQHVVEDALQRSLDPGQSVVPIMKPKEVQLLINQFREILNSGHEFYMTTTAACIRGTFGLLQAERRVASLPHQLNAAPPEPGRKRKGRLGGKRGHVPPPAVAAEKSAAEKIA